MVYILGIEINEKKPLGYILCKLYGINYTSALRICTAAGFNSLRPVTQKAINEGIFQGLQRYISRAYIVGTVIQKITKENIKKEIQLGTYCGMRHRLRLPVRGQRTHTNRMSQRRSIL